jgi:hypothetical protein
MAVSSLDLGLESPDGLCGVSIDLEKKMVVHWARRGERDMWYLVHLLLGGLDCDLHGGWRRRRRWQTRNRKL